MSFKDTYPEYASIEHHIRRARAERSVAIAHALAGLVVIIGRGLKRLASITSSGLAAERDRRAIEADAFLKRSVPRY
jgi:hypothetical protein